MADNFPVTPSTDGTAVPIRTIAKGGIDTEVVVIDLGGAGAESLLTTSMPIQDGGNVITVDGTVTANLSATDNAVLDAIVAALPAALAANGGLKVEGVAGGVAVPVSLATVPSHAVTNAGTFATQESGAALTALQLIDNMISGSEAQVDVITMPVTHVIADSGTVTTITNVVHVDDNSGTLTVDGTVTANLSATDNAVLDAIVAALPAALAANGGLKVEGVASGVAQPVSIASLPALTTGSAAIGKLAANSGVDIGDVDVTSIAAGENHLGAIGGNSTVIDLTVASAAAAYVSGDLIGAELTIAGAARINGGTGKITGITLSDYALQSVQGELWITDTAVAEPADNAAWTISDAESATVVAVIPFALYYASALNSVAPVGNLSIPFKCTAGVTALYCCFVTRGAPTYIANGLHLKIFIDQD